MLPGGEDDPIRAAQQALEDARREAKDTGDSGSEAKTEAEYAVLKVGRGVAGSPRRRARRPSGITIGRKNMAPTRPTRIRSTRSPARRCPNKLTDEQMDAFADALTQADRALREAERAVEQAKRAADKAHEDEIVKNDAVG